MKYGANFVSEPIIIAGGSHSTCLGVPHHSIDSEPVLVQLDDPRFVGMTGHFPRNQEYWDALVGRSARRTVAILWSGNQHYARFLLRYTPQIDVILPGNDGLPIEVDATVVPVMAIKELFSGTFDGLPDLLRKLGQKGARPVLVGTPPPKRDEASIRRAVVLQDDFVRAVAKYNRVDLATAKLTPRIVMYKFWSIIQAMLSDCARDNDALFVSVPDEVHDDQGFLRDQSKHFGKLT
jgi:hypothetical protein